MNYEQLSRRSFLKKTTAFAVGISVPTLMTGLVNATNQYICFFRGKTIRKIKRGSGSNYSCYDVTACTDINGNPTDPCLTNEQWCNSVNQFCPGVPTG